MQKINNIHIAIISVLVSLLVYMGFNFTFLISSGVGLFFFLFLKMTNDLGTRIPMKEVMGILLLIQIFISPLFAYKYFNNKAHFTMYIDETIYFYFAIPAAFFFIIGLFIPLTDSNFKQEQFFSRLKKLSNSKTQQIAKAFILIGLSTSLFTDFIPTSLFFVFYLIKLLKFIGAFILFFSNNKMKYIWLIIVYSIFAVEIIEGGVFYDLFVWGFFLYMLLEYKFKSSLLRKLTIILGGFFIIYFIQSIKGAYRSEAWSKTTKKGNTELFINSIENKSSVDNKGDFDRFISRLNNGWILSKVMEHTPKKEPFTQGETLKNDLISILLPRFLFPNKIKTGGKQNQKKFTQFTGRRLIGATTMRIGAVSDTYINFGVIGGWITMFVLGFFFNITLYFIIKLSTKNPYYIIWIPFIFAYAIRMSDIQVILNYTFKAFIFVLIINNVFFKIEKKTIN